MNEKRTHTQQSQKLIKRLLLTGVSGLAIISLRAQTIDISLQSHYAAQKDTTVVAVLSDMEDVEFTDKEFIQETYQIPGYSLYDKYWDTEHICSRHLSIPFEGNPLRIILIQSNNNPFFFPIAGNYTVLTMYGETKNSFHPGVDIAIRQGSPVKCCFDGVVRMARIYGDYGMVVVVRHYNGLETVYANLGKIMVKPGQILQAGDIIGASGKAQKTGVEQLHFETRFMNECFNPAMIIDFDYMELKDNTLILNETDLAVQEERKEEIKIEEKKKEVQENKTEEKTQENKGKAEYHIVKAGETMYRISIQYHIPLAKLLQMNNMKETDVIDIGQRIRVK